MIISSKKKNYSSYMEYQIYFLPKKKAMKLSVHFTKPILICSVVFMFTILTELSALIMRRICKQH